MKRVPGNIYDGYTTLNPVAIPEIPCIDPLTFATNLATKHRIWDYMHKLLSADINDYDKIYLIVVSHRHQIRLIEKFDYGQADNKYVYFIIDTFDKETLEEGA